MVIYQSHNLLLGVLDELSVLSVSLFKLALPQKFILDSDGIIDVGPVVIGEIVDFIWLSAVLIKIVFSAFQFWEFKVLRSS